MVWLVIGSHPDHGVHAGRQPPDERERARLLVLHGGGEAGAHRQGEDRQQPHAQGHLQRRQGLHRVHAGHPGPVDGLRPHEGRRHRRGEARGGAFPPHEHLRVVVPDAAADRRVDLLHAPDAGRRARRRVLVRQVARAHARREPEPGHVRRRRGRRRGQGRGRRAGRIPARPDEVPEARRAHPARRADGGLARHRQDASRARHRGRGEGARSSRSPAPTSSRCSWAWVRRACATCSSRPRRTRPASCSSTRSTRSAASAARAWAAATTSASRR